MLKDTRSREDIAQEQDARRRVRTALQDGRLSGPRRLPPAAEERPSAANERGAGQGQLPPAIVPERKRLAAPAASGNAERQPSGGWQERLRRLEGGVIPEARRLPAADGGMTSTPPTEATDEEIDRLFSDRPSAPPMQPRAGKAEGKMPPPSTPQVPSRVKAPAGRGRRRRPKGLMDTIADFLK
jgi:hypothetical protein